MEREDIKYWKPYRSFKLSNYIFLAVMFISKINISKPNSIWMQIHSP